MKKLYLLCALFLFLAGNKWAQNAYSWNGTSTNWNISTNWTPERTTPANDDILIFDGSIKAASVVTALPTQTIGKLILMNNAVVDLSATSVATLTISGGAGTDFDIPSGSTLKITGEFGVTITINAGANGNIAGTFQLPGNSTTTNIGHQLLPTDVGSLIITGTVIQGDATGSKLKGNLFGSSGPDGVVIFAAGSSFYQRQASNPFATSGQGRVVFQSGSNYYYYLGGTPSLSGRNYANLIFGNVQAPSATSSISSDCTIENLTNETSNVNLNTTGAGKLIIKGNITHKGSYPLTLGAGGGVELSGNNAQVIDGNSTKVTTFTNLTMNNSKGVTLNRGIIVSSSLVLTNGNLTTSNTNLLTLSSVATVTGGSSSSFVNGPMANTWSTTTGTKIYPLGKGSSYHPMEINLTNPSSPVIRAEYNNINAGGDKGILNAISTNGYYQTSLVSGSAAGGGTVKLTYNAEDVVNDYTSLVVAQSSSLSGVYSSLGRTASDALSVTSLNYNPASGDFLLLADTGTNPLPVELITLTAIQDAEKVNLYWQTATEVNNSGFEVERLSSDGNWIKIGFVSGHGNSNSKKNYSFTDDKVIGGSEVTYRLKQIDTDGNFKYSDVVTIALNAPNGFKLMQNSPNPFNPTTAVKFQLPVNSFVTIKVYDLLGKEVTTLVSEERSAGSHIVYWNGRDSRGEMVSSGIYLYSLSAGNYYETKKMNLMK